MSTQGPKVVAALPLEGAPPGWVLCPIYRDEGVDRFYGDWEAPVVAPGRWRMLGLIEAVVHPRLGRKVLWFNLAHTDPSRTDRPNWGTRYDRALVTRETMPRDATVRATLAVRDPVTSATADNNVLIRPWVGIVARMQDVRHYYFLCLEYPDAVVLYRREDDTWLELGRHPMPVRHWRFYDMTLGMRGDRLEGWVNGQMVISATDYCYRDGKAGVRATCSSYVASYVIEASEKAVDRHQAALVAARKEVAGLSAELPRPMLAKAIDLRALGQVANVTFGPFAGPEKPPQLFVGFAQHARGVIYALRALEGAELWEASLPPMSKHILTMPREDGHCDIYGRTSEEILLIDGRSGKVIVRRPLASLPGWPNQNGKNFPQSPVRLRAGPQAREYLMRQTQSDCDNVWALDEGLDVLWHVQVPDESGHDWSLGACDVDGDGREEILVGTTLISPDGEVIWTQMEVQERLKVPYGGHVDALALGFFGGPDDGPTAHLQSSSAGNIVLEARTGEIIAVHPQGHVQGRHVANFVPDEPGLQILTGCRWGNYGLLSVYSGDGRRLSTFQPDYVGQSGPALNWAGDGIELAVIVSDVRRAGAYDYLGRWLLDLRPFMPVQKGTYTPYHAGQCFCQDVLGDARDEIILHSGGIVNIVTQEESIASEASVYAPRRRWNISYPEWRTR